MRRIPSLVITCLTVATALAVTVLYFEQSSGRELATAEMKGIQEIVADLEKNHAPADAVTWRDLIDIIRQLPEGNDLSRSQSLSAPAQEEILARLDRLEMENKDLRSKLEAVAGSDADHSLEDTINNVQDSVVSIIVKRKLNIRRYGSPFFGDPFQDESGDDSDGFSTREFFVGGGSGFIISTDGYVLTNRHVVNDIGADYTVILHDGTELPAQVIARDPYQDIAVIKVDSTGKDLQFQPVRFGTSADIRVGEKVIAIGNALSQFENTVTTGIISALGRNIVAVDGMRGVEEISNLLQTDAAINPGNSGGPLVNIRGEVIGMNTAIARGANGIGFAIPVDELKAVAESVMKHGEIVRPFLGIRYQMITPDNANDLGVDLDYGALVSTGQEGESAVIADSPADKAGIREGDIILEIDGEKVTSVHDIRMVIMQKNVGDEIELKILGDHAERTIKVKLEQIQ